MPNIARPVGLWTAVLTPLDSDYRCDIARLRVHCRGLLDAGCDGIAVFGTTGEGPEFPIRERLITLEALLTAGIPPDRLIVSAASPVLADSIELGRHASQVGVAGTLLMPPFLFRSGVTDDGVFAFYTTLIDRIGTTDLRALLYHIPAVSGIAIRPSVIRRLVERYGEIIVGIKDSGGDWTYTLELLNRFSRLSIFTGTETHIPLALENYGAGTICGLGNIICPILRRVFDCVSLTERRQMLPLIQRADALMSRGAFVACMRACIAAEKGDSGWARTMPPMMALAAMEAKHLVADFRRLLALAAEPVIARPACNRQSDNSG